MPSSRRVAPELLQAGVAATPLPGTVVPERILLVEVLVVLLGRKKRRGRGDLRHDFPLEARHLFDPLLRLLGGFPLRLVLVEDRRAVLRAVVAELAVGLRRIDVVPEDLEQLLVGNLGRVVSYLD